ASLDSGTKRNGTHFALDSEGACMQPPIRHILVPTDFSLASEHAVACARTRAGSFGATIHLVHVLEEPFVTPGAYQIHLPDTTTRREERYQQSQPRLTRPAGVLDDA